MRRPVAQLHRADFNSIKVQLELYLRFFQKGFDAISIP